VIESWTRSASRSNERVPTINLADDELAAVMAALRRAIEDDRYPHAPRLDPLRAALGKLEAASSDSVPRSADTPPSAKADKRARSAKAPAPKISPGFKLGRLPPDR
jgi:hypothetical protein